MGHIAFKRTILKYKNLLYIYVGYIYTRGKNSYAN